MVEKEVDVLQYLKLFWRYKYLVLFCLILFSSIGYFFYQHEIPTYTATGYLEIGREIVGQSFDIGNVQTTESITTSAKSYSFVSKVIKDLELNNYPIKKGLMERIKDRDEQ